MVLKGGNEVIVTCNCGCGESIYFKNDFNLIWVSTLSSDFYVRQLPFTTGIRHLYRDLENRHRNKGRLFISEVILKEQELLDMIPAIEDLISSLDDSKLDEGDRLTIEEKDKSTLHMTNLELDDYGASPEWREYSLELESHLSLKDILLHNHRQYDACYSREEMEVFLKKARRMLKKEYDKNLERKTKFLLEGERFKNTVVNTFKETIDDIHYFECTLLDTNETKVLSEREVLEREDLI